MKFPFLKQIDESYINVADVLEIIIPLFYFDKSDMAKDLNDSVTTLFMFDFRYKLTDTSKWVEGKITLPIILAYLRSNNKEKEFWHRTIVELDQSKDDLTKAIVIIKKYNCIENTIDRARHFVNVAIDSLGAFENNEYKKSLMNLIAASLTRFN